MAELTGNTAGTLKKYVPKVKTKAITAVPAFSNFINGIYGDAPKATPNKGTKRKVDQDADINDNSTADVNAEGSDEGGPVTEDKEVRAKKKVAGKGKGRGKKATNQEDEASAEGDAEEKKPGVKKPRGKVAAKKTKSDDEVHENGDNAEETQEKEPAAKKPRGKAGAKKMKPDEKDEEEVAAEEKEEQVENEA
jgi:hypothetical protein